jgi:hypothetical protein
MDDRVDELAGPDERDLDLLDGSWESRYYGGKIKRRDWSTVMLGVALLVALSLIVPMVYVFAR